MVVPARSQPKHAAPEDAPGPFQGGQGDTGPLGHLQAQRQAGRGQDAGGPEPLRSCSSQSQVLAPTLPVGPVFPSGPSSLLLSPADAQQALGWGRHRSPEPAVGAASPLAFLPHSLLLYFLFFPRWRVEKGHAASHTA